MSGDLRVVQWSFQQNISKAKKKKPNPFLLFRSALRKYLPGYENMPMTEFSKIASEFWKNLSSADKAVWRAHYDINKDLSDNEGLLEMTTITTENDSSPINNIQNDTFYPNNEMVCEPLSLFFICNFCQSFLDENTSCPCLNEQLLMSPSYPIFNEPDSSFIEENVNLFNQEYSMKFPDWI